MNYSDGIIAQIPYVPIESFNLLERDKMHNYHMYICHICAGAYLIFFSTLVASQKEVKILL